LVSYILYIHTHTSEYGRDDRGSFPDKDTTFCRHDIQTASEVYAASYQMGTGIFSP